MEHEILKNENRNQIRVALSAPFFADDQIGIDNDTYDASFNMVGK